MNFLIFSLVILGLYSGPVKTQLLNNCTSSSTDVKFYLYTPQNPVIPQNLITGQLIGVALDKTLQFKFIIHGYINSGNETWVLKMKDEYFKKGDYNVVAVDWSSLSYQIYDDAAYCTRTVGGYTAEFISDLHYTLGVPYAQIHLIGHSLGAHVSGFTGQYLQQTESTTVRRITGMDPAGPLFTLNPPEDRLSPGDANYVDVIHTDGNEYGYYNPCGNSDFYPNGGLLLQPGCLTRRRRSDNSTLSIGCSHSRAYLYFTESFSTSGFIARKCASYSNYLLRLCNNNQIAIMGENINEGVTGLYYLTTNAFSPYARYGQI